MGVRGYICAVAVGLALAGCAGPPEDAADGPPSMGDFRLGFNVVVVGDALQGPGSQTVEDAVLQRAVETAVLRELGGYNGDGLYHLGIRVDAYALATRGSGRESGLLMAVNVWDEATKRALTAVPLEIAGTLPAGSGDLEALAASAASALAVALAENADTWFAPTPGQPRIPFDRFAQQ